MASRKKERKTTSVGQNASTVFSQGSVYEGTVLSFDPSKELYQVRVQSQKMVCTYASPIFTKILGIQGRYILHEGTEVQVVAQSTGKGVIIAAKPGQPTQTLKPNDALNTMLDLSGEASELDKLVSSIQAPKDLLEGEFDMTSALGSGIQLLSFLSRLKSGDLAVVETSMINDLVRIISGTFKHHSAVGDEWIYNDSRLGYEQQATSYEFESWGLKKDSTEKLIPDDENVGDLPGPSNVKDPRWRFSSYLGFVGNFMHMMLSDPASASEEIGRAGKARMQMMNDGSLLMQSVADISIERVCRCVVPIRTGESSRDEVEKELQGRFTELWATLNEVGDPASSREDIATLSDMAFHLREYARWLNTYHSLGRMEEHPDFVVPTESGAEAPVWTNDEKDVEDSNDNALTSYDVYACYRIMRDGSIVVVSGDGSAITMSNGHMQISASRHLDISAPGDIRINAGRDLHIVSRRHTHITSMVGGILIKARTYWEAICELGSMWLKSDAEKFDPDAEEGDEHEDPDNPKERIREYGVYISSSKSGVGVAATTNLDLTSLGNKAYIEDSESEEEEPLGQIRIKNQGTGGIELLSNGPLVSLNRDTHIRAQGRLLLDGQTILNTWVGGWIGMDAEGVPFVQISPRGDINAQRITAEIADLKNITSRNVQGICTAGDSPQEEDDFTWRDYLPEEDTVTSIVEDELNPVYEPALETLERRPLKPNAPLGYGDYWLAVDRVRETLTEQWLRLERFEAWDEDYETRNIFTEGRLKGMSSQLGDTAADSFFTDDELTPIAYLGGDKLSEPFGRGFTSLPKGISSFNPGSSRNYFSNYLKAEI